MKRLAKPTTRAKARALPAAPPEVQRLSILSVCAPLFREAVKRVLVDMRERGLPCVVVETLRTAERQAFLYGFGRQYDDGRGRVTNASTSLTSWHGYGLAADIVHAERYWNAAESFWIALAETAEKHGLASGYRWKSKDRPHVQWGQCASSPTDVDRETFLRDGFAGIWRRVKADV